MICKAFLMYVDPEKHEEYEKRHNPIWPELEEVLKSHGVHKYSIFLEPESNQLFAYVEMESIEQWETIAQTEVCQKWWESMKDLMPTNPDNSPVTKDLREVFHISR